MTIFHCSITTTYLVPVPEETCLVPVPVETLFGTSRDMFGTSRDLFRTSTIRDLFRTIRNKSAIQHEDPNLGVPDKIIAWPLLNYKPHLSCSSTIDEVSPMDSRPHVLKETENQDQAQDQSSDKVPHLCQKLFKSVVIHTTFLGGQN